MNEEENIGKLFSTGSVDQADKKDYISVNEYLDNLNEGLYNFSGRVIGEISDLKLYEGRSYLYFSIKDKEAGAILACFMWKKDYFLSGVLLEDGLEVIISGFPKVYKPNGGMVFQTQSVELVGEGALKKAYDLLKKKLEIEGLFSITRKRRIPDFPQNIGLITSASGAVIHDFRTNLGRYGFHTKFIDSKVEGQMAVRDLVSAINYFNGKAIDVLVIIRGGGSLESLQAFNNESLIRKIASFPKPVICGIGHEKDVPLASLVADKMVSTPTAVANTLNESWQNAVYKLDLNKETIFSLFKDIISSDQKNVSKSFDVIKRSFQTIFDDFKKVEESLKRSFVSIQSRILEIRKNIVEYPKVINNRMRFLIRDLSEKTNLKNTFKLFKNVLAQITESVLSAEKLIIKSDPKKQLKLGYSIVQSDGVLIRKINQIKKGQMVNVMVEDGDFMSEVKIINKG